MVLFGLRGWLFVITFKCISYDLNYTWWRLKEPLELNKPETERSILLPQRCETDFKCWILRYCFPPFLSILYTLDSFYLTRSNWPPWCMTMLTWLQCGEASRVGRTESGLNALNEICLESTQLLLCRRGSILGIAMHWKEKC